MQLGPPHLLPSLACNENHAHLFLLAANGDYADGTYNQSYELGFFEGHLVLTGYNLLLLRNEKANLLNKTTIKYTLCMTVRFLSSP
jgi:hypothetical protein